MVWIIKKLKNVYRVIEYIVENPELKIVILVARWAANIEGGSYGVESNKPIKLVDTLSVETQSTSKDNVLVMTRALKRTIEKLVALNRKVVLMTQVPEVGYDVESVAFIAKKTSRQVNDLIAPELESYINRNKRASELFEEIKDRVTVVEPYKILCDSKKCNVEQKSALLYKDDDHLSSYGAKQVSSIFDFAFRQ